MDNATPAPKPEIAPEIADLLKQSIAQVENASAAEKAEVLKDLAETHAAIEAKKKAAEKAKAKEAEKNAKPKLIPAAVIRMPNGTVRIPTFVKHVYLSAPAHQVVCSKCKKAVVANEMAMVKQLSNGSDGWRHLSCAGTHLVK